MPAGPGRRPISVIVALVGKQVRVSHGVWRSPDAVTDLGGWAGALLSRLPDYSVAAGSTAGLLHGLWLPCEEQPAVLDVVLRGGVDVPRAHAGSRRDEVRGRRRALRDDEVVLVRGLPVTSLSRTWIDLAEELSLPDLVAAGDSALRLGATSASLEEAVRRAAGRRGVVRARIALTLLDRRSRSRPESHLRVGLVVRGLLPTGVNTPLHDADGQWLAEPDLSFDDALLAIEYNGADHATPKRMQRDITREFDLDERGNWLTIVVGPVQVFQRIDQTAAYIKRVRRGRLPRTT